jgi:O-antigen/teichoic acid export membrane protein
MSTLRKNILANFAGTIWSTLLAIGVVPVYVHFLGIEAYGLVGLFATVQAISSLLEVGLSPTMNREFARLSSESDGVIAMRDLLRTMELVYWGVAIGVGLLIASLAPAIANHWVRPQLLPLSQVEHAFFLMGFAFAAQWPSTLYMSGLLGLQRHGRLNGLMIATSTFRATGALLVLWLVAPSITAFFLWQIVAAAVQTITLGYALWRSLRWAAGLPHFSPAALKRIWRFAAGMSGITVLKVLLTQADKVTLSRLLPLDTYGYYALAGTAASGLNKLVGPFFTAYYPKLSELWSRRQHEELRRVYHLGGQLLAVVLLPATATLALFAREVLWLWTGDLVIATTAHLLLTLIATAAGLNGLMSLPYALQLASGWTRLPFLTNAVAVLLLVPLLVIATIRWGAVGAASVSVALNVGYLLFNIPIMHRRILPAEAGRWYTKTVGAPLAAALVVAGLGRALLPAGSSKIVSALSLLAVWIAATTAAALTISWIREKGLLALYDRWPTLRAPSV